MLPAGALVLVAVFASAIFFTVSGPSGQAKHKAAIEKVLAQWDAIRERGLAKQTSGIDEIIANARSMVRSGKAIDASGCPEEFLLAWGDYLRAFEKSIEFLIEGADRLTQTQVSLEKEKTREAVSIIAKRYGVNW